MVVVFGQDDEDALFGVHEIVVRFRDVLTLVIRTVFIVFFV